MTLDDSDYDEVPVSQAGKRCGVQWAPWMGDWFTSWSPRNSNSNAEGPWDHWVDLAVMILQDPLTATVRPGAHAAAQGLPTHDFYADALRPLSREELTARFAPPALPDVANPAPPQPGADRSPLPPSDGD